MQISYVGLTEVWIQVRCLQCY